MGSLRPRGRGSGTGRGGGARVAAPALALKIPSAGEGTESQGSPNAGGRPARAALNQGGLPTAHSLTEGLGGRACGRPLFWSLAKEGRPLRRLLWGSGVGVLLEVGAAGWSMFLLECQWFEQGVVFEWGKITLSLLVLSENNAALRGLWRWDPSVNKVAQHLYSGGRTPEDLALAQTFIIIVLSLLQQSIFAVFFSEFGCMGLGFTSNFFRDFRLSFLLKL